MATHLTKTSTQDYLSPAAETTAAGRKRDHTFSPHYFTGYNLDDNYAKKTCLWTGGGLCDAGREPGRRLERTRRPDSQMPTWAGTPQHTERHPAWICAGGI